MARYQIETAKGPIIVDGPAGLSGPEVIDIYNNRVGTATARRTSEFEGASRKQFETQVDSAEAIARSQRRGVSDYLGEVPKGLIGGATGMVETGALGLAALLPEGAEDVVRGGIKAVGGAVQDYVAPDFNLEESIPRKVSEATGSFIGLAGTTMINPIAGVGLAVAAGAGEASERARAEGASVEDRNLSAILGIIPGALELLPIKFLSVINKAQKAKIGDALTRIVEQSGIEAGQEAVSSITQNLIAREVYKPDQSLVEGTGEEAALGGTVGAIIQSTLELVTPRTRGGASGADVADAGPQGELFPGEDLGQAPQRQEPTSDQAELFPDADLGQAPEGPDSRQGDLFAAPEETLARRVKELEREKTTVMNRPMSEAIAEFEAKDDKFFERNKRERDAARVGIASLETAKRRPEATTRDMRDMVAESQDQVADEQARDRAGLAAAEREDVAAFEQPDLFAQELESEQRRLGPKELRDPEQYMDATLFEEAETPEFVRPAAERDLVDIIGEDTTATASAAVRRDKAGRIEQDVENRQAQEGQTKAESAAETAQEKLVTDRTARTTATRTRVLQDTVANAGEVRRPEALRKLYEDALAREGIADTKVNPAEMESLRRASNVIRAKAPAAETIAAREEVKDPRQLAMEARVAPKAPKGSTPLNEPAVTDVDLRQFLEGNLNAKRTNAKTSGVSPAGAGPSPADARRGADGSARKSTTPVGLSVGPTVLSDGVSGAGAAPSSDTLTGRKLARDIFDKARSPEAKAKAKKQAKEMAEYGVSPEQEAAFLARQKITGESALKPKVMAKPKAKFSRDATPGKETGLGGQVIPGLARSKTTGKKLSADVKGRFAPKARVGGKRETVKDQSAATKEVRANLKKRWEDTAPEVNKREYNANENIVKGDPFTPAENRKILKRLETPVKKAEKETLDAVVTYLGLYPNPAEGLRLAMVDVAMGTPQSRGDSLLKGTGGKAANKAVAWATENLDSRGKDWLRKTTIAIQADLDSVADASMTVAQIKAAGVSDAVQAARDKAAVEAQLEEAAAAREAADAKDFDAEKQLNFTRIKVEKLLEANAVVGLDLPQAPSVMSAIKVGNLKDALDALVDTSPSKHVRQTAQAYAKLVGTTKLVTKKNLKAKDGRAVAGLFDPETNTITLDEEAGINTHTIMHEMSHAVTSAEIANSKSSAGQQFTKLFNDVKEYLGSAYGATNADEFLAEAQSNPLFRADLASINMQGEEVTALQRYFNIMNNILSRYLPFIKSRNITILQEVDGFVDALLAPAPQYRNANQMAMMSTREGVKKFMSGVVDTTQKAVSEGSRKQLGYDSADFLHQTVSRTAKNLLVRLKGMQGLADLGEAVGLGKMGFVLDELVSNQRGSIQTANKITEDKIKNILQVLGRGTPEKVVARRAALDDVIYNTEYGATIFQVDPTKPRTEYINKKDGSPVLDTSGNNLLEIWDKQRPSWKAMGPEGQQAYNDMRKIYKTQYEKLKAVIFGQIDNLVADKVAAGKLKKDIFAKLFKESTLDVYFPLMREGDFVLRFDAKDPKSDREKTTLVTFTTAAERDAVQKSLAATEEYTNFEPSDKGIMAESFRGGGADLGFATQTLDILDSAGVAAEIKDQVMRLFVNSLPETSFAKSLQKRKGTPGYMQDSVLALKEKGYSLASQTVKLEYAAKLRNYEKDLSAFKQLEVRKAKSLVGMTAEKMASSFEDVRAELLNRAEFARRGAKNESIENIARRLNQTAFIYTIGFNASSAIVNLSQIPLFVAPFLGGKYGYAKTTSAISNAYGNVNFGGKRGGKTNSILNYYDISDAGEYTLKTGLDLPDGKAAELKRMIPLVKTAANRGLLGQGFIAEAMGLNEASKTAKGSKVGNAMDNVSVLSAWLFNHGEQLNRQVTLMASFDLALDQITGGKSNSATTAQVEQAVQDAIYTTQETNGGTFLETAPSLLREHVGRVAGMYKSYGLQMYYVMFKTAKIAFDSDKGKLFGKEGSPERKAAWKQLIGMHMTALFFAGVQGLPLYGAVRLITNLFFLDEEEEDLDTIARKYFGEGWYKGAITKFAGIDVASRMALTGLLIQENRYNNDPSLEETLGFYFGGPALSVAGRLYRGGSDLYNGETQRGIESILPAGVTNAWKASFGRYQQEGGAFTRRGDPIYDDMTGGELAGIFFGFQPTELTFRQEQNNSSKGIDIAVTQRRSALSKKYYVAQRMRDYSELQKIRAEMREFSRRHPEARIDKEYLDRSLKQHKKTSEKMKKYNGISISPTYQAAIDQLRREYKQ